MAIFNCNTGVYFFFFFFISNVNALLSVNVKSRFIINNALFPMYLYWECHFKSRVLQEVSQIKVFKTLYFYQLMIGVEYHHNGNVTKTLHPIKR